MKVSQEFARRRASIRAHERRHWSASLWQIVARAIVSALAISSIAVLLALVVVPRLMGGDALTVLSGSMEPTFAPGDIVAVKGVDKAEVCNDVSIGAIVTYFPKPNDPELITHRVIGKTIGTFEDQTRCRLILQGDANSAADDPVSPTQLRGVFMYGVPKLGWARQWLKDNTVLATAALIGVLIIAGGLSAMRRPQTTVMTVPRRGSGANQEAATPSAVKPVAATARDRELRDRELLLRERELELRERELAHAIASSALVRGEASAPGTQRSKD